MKYIYGPATVNADHDAIIGLQGGIEAGIGINRLTTIIMPMKGSTLPLQPNYYIYENDLYPCHT